MLRANPNPPHAALAPQATTNKDKESHHRSVREIVIQITITTDLISDVLPYGALWYAGPTQSIMQSATQSFAAAHMTLRFAFSMIC